MHPRLENYYLLNYYVDWCLHKTDTIIIIIVYYMFEVYKLNGAFRV